MFTVTLYSFQKPNNSMRLPSGGGDFPAMAVEPCSVVNPTISFNQGVDWNPSGYNYAHISEFNRYYWITEWTFNAGIWYATMSVDPLASFKDEILSREEYVIRSASEWDLDIPDGKYPAQQDPTFVSQKASSVYSADTLADGTYVLGVANGYTSSVGGITYYCGTQDEMASVFEFMYANTDWFNGPSIDEISTDLQKCLFNPAQYLTSLMWFPFSMDDVSSSISRYVGAGWWELGVSLHTPVGKVEKEVRLGRPNHPQYSRGHYLNYAPYTTSRVYVPGFGSVDLNLDRYRTGSPIAKIQVDVITGQGQLCIYPSDGDIGSGQVVNGQIGVPIALTSMMSDPIGAVSTITNGAAAGASGGSILSSIVGGVLGAAGSVYSAAQELTPDVTVMGGNGNMSIFQNPITQTVLYKTLVEEDMIHFGRPLMKKRTLSSLSGFTQVEHFDTNLTATLTEQQQIKAYMESGVYIE